MTRLELLARDEIPDEYQHLFTDDYLGDRHIFRVWAHNPEVLEATLEYLDTLYDQLTPRTKELVILTVARARNARYEWHQHVDIARDKGVEQAEMRAIGDSGSPVLSVWSLDTHTLSWGIETVSRERTGSAHSCGRYRPR